jgi:hypothetical protein
MCPANTFDNVKGNFPIGFILWNTNVKNEIKSIYLDIVNSSVDFLGQKLIYIPKGEKGNSSMNDWIKKNESQNNKFFLGHLNCSSQDFLHQNYTGISINKQNSAYKQLPINEKNIFFVSVYFSMTFCIQASWLNDRDQFLYPNDNWKTDTEFQNDCLAFTLFDGQNRIANSEGTNHWIPFTEQEVNAKEKFASSFMTDFMNGKIKIEQPTANTLFDSDTDCRVPRNDSRLFSEEATAVFDAGRALWSYYHSQKEVNVNASLYDIREYFQGRNAAGRMNPRSEDATYSELIGNLRKKLTELADKIKPKVYEYEFLKE